MKIGTPSSATATKALLLGSGELGKEIAISLQRYGVEVIAVDRYANAPAMQVAHLSYVIDMTDGDAVKQLVERVEPDFIIPEIENIATDALADIEAKGGVTVVPNARAVQLTMNREGIRTLAAESVGVPTSAYAFADSFEQLQQAVEITGYPCFVKPTMSSSGKGQSLVRSESELQAAWKTAKTGGRAETGKVIVEGLVEFDYETTLLTIRARNQSGEIDTYFCQAIGHRQEDGDYRESWQPQPMSENAWRNAKIIAKEITDAIGGLGLFGVELFIKGDQVWFSEVSPRPHDTGMVTMATQRQSEFDLHVRAILGLPVSTELEKPGASAVILSKVDSDSVVYEGLDQALAIENTELRLFGKPQAYIKRRMGVALAVAENVKQARDNAVKSANLVSIKIKE